MEWVGVAAAFVGAILLYSAIRNLSPWSEFTATLSSAAKPAG